MGIDIAAIKSSIENVVGVNCSNVIGKCTDTIPMSDTNGQLCKINFCHVPKNPGLAGNSGATIQ